MTHLGIEICKVVIYNYFVLALISCQIWFYFCSIICTLYFMWDFIVWVVCEREREESSTYWRQSGFRKKFCKKSSCKVSHVQNTWLECKESWQLVFASISRVRHSRETFCFAILAYLLHHIFTHTIYTHITHILWLVLFREKTLDIILES